MIIKKVGYFVAQNLFIVIAFIALILGFSLAFSLYRYLVPWILDGAGVIVAVFMLVNIVKNLRDGIYKIDFLTFIALITTIFLNQYIVVLILIFLISLENEFLKIINKRTFSNLNKALTYKLPEAKILKNRKTIIADPSALKIGDNIVLQPGDITPADATIVSGVGKFDERKITSNHTLRTCKVNDLILQGSINTGGTIIAKVRSNALGSHYQQNVSLCHQAIKSTIPLEKTSIKYSFYFTIITLITAGLTWYFTGQSIRFLEIILVADTSMLLYSSRLAVISGVGDLLINGIAIRSASAFQYLAEIKTLILTQTGVLTTGILNVKEIKSTTNISSKDLLSLSFGITKNSNLAFAQAINAYALKNTTKAAKIKNIQQLSRNTMAGNYKGQIILIGPFSEIKDINSNLLEKPVKFDSPDDTIYIFVNNVFEGMIVIKEELRQESKEAVKYFQKDNLNYIWLFSGNNQKIADYLAHETGIKKVVANMSSLDMLDKISAMSSQKPTVLVEAAPITSAYTSVCDVVMSLNAREVTREKEFADFIIIDDNLLRLLTAHKITKQTFNIAKQTIIIGFSLTVILMLISISGLVSIYLAVIFRALLFMGVVFNLLRLNKVKKSF